MDLTHILLIIQNLLIFYILALDYLLMEYRTLDVYKKIIDNRQDDSSSDEEEIINNKINESDENVMTQRILIIYKMMIKIQS